MCMSSTKASSMSFICNAITANSDTEPIERQPGVPLSYAARERQNHAFLRVRLLLSLRSKPTQASTNALACSSAHLPTARWAEPQTTSSTSTLQSACHPIGRPGSVYQAAYQYAISITKQNSLNIGVENEKDNCNHIVGVNMHDH